MNAKMKVKAKHPLAYAERFRSTGGYRIRLNRGTAPIAFGATETEAWESAWEQVSKEG